jgi:hypothetical protein
MDHCYKGETYCPRLFFYTVYSRSRCSVSCCGSAYIVQLRQPNREKAMLSFGITCSRCIIASLLLCTVKSGRTDALADGCKDTQTPVPPACTFLPPRHYPALVTASAASGCLSKHPFQLPPLLPAVACAAASAPVPPYDTAAPAGVAAAAAAAAAADAATILLLLVLLLLQRMFLPPAVAVSASFICIFLPLLCSIWA